MNTQEQNELIKICFNGNKHLKHVLSSDEINNMTMIENRFPLSKLPVCGHCEKLALWGKGMSAVCRSCGTITQVPITYATYLASGYDVDATGHTAKRVLKTEEELMPVNQRILILPDFSHLEKK